MPVGQCRPVTDRAANTALLLELLRDETGMRAAFEVAGRILTGDTRPDGQVISVGNAAHDPMIVLAHDGHRGSGAEADVGDVGVGAPVGVEFGDDVVPDPFEFGDVAAGESVDCGVPDVADLDAAYP